MRIRANGLYKYELIYRRDPGQRYPTSTFVTLAHVDWFNNQRLHGGMIPLDLATRHLQTTKSTTTVNTSPPNRW